MSELEGSGARRSAWLAPKSASRRRLLALAVWLAATLVFVACASTDTRERHTPYNHFALLASSWLEGRLDLGGPPPAYTGRNDFARYHGKWFVVFPSLPAALLVPVVAAAGDVSAVRDGLVFLLWSGAPPAVLFLVLEKLRRVHRSPRSEAENLALSGLYAFGSVYFFSAVQGTVWYAAHVVGALCLALYVLFAIDGERPLLAGVSLALGFATRTPLLFAAPFFLLESYWRRRDELDQARLAGLVTNDSRWSRALLPPRLAWRWLADLAWFGAPIALGLGLTLWHNHARFGDAFEVGYRYLDVVWARRIEKWGLFDYHYLARNLGVMWTSLPWVGPDAAAPFRINGHGLALWFTTPLYFWLLWPARRNRTTAALWIAVACVAVPTLFYQNTGWVQFGYRFSNDYAPLLFTLLALGGRSLKGAFALCAAWSVLVNFFGALTFGRPEHARYYFIERSQQILYEPD